MPHKWRHEATFIAWKRKIRVTCKCGVISPVFVGDDAASREDQAAAWYAKHTKLEEKRPRRSDEE